MHMPPQRSDIKMHLQAFASRTTVIVGATSLHVGCEYPFWSVKVHMQNNPSKNQHAIKTAKALYQQKGVFKGWYPGAAPFFMLTLFKQSYRLPALVFLPNYFQNWVPEEWEFKHQLTSVGAATTLSLFEASVFGPIERVVSYKMIHDKLPSITVRFLYTGTGISLSKGLYSWNLFSTLENFANRKAKNLLNTNTLDTQSTFGVGVFVGCSMTALTHPLSTLQTFAQTRSVEDPKPMLTGFKEYLKKNGTKALFSGIRPALAQGIVRSSITVFALDKIRGNRPT